MSRYPSVDRAVAQLERHGSGTPNDVPPVPSWWGVTMASFGFSVSTAQLGAVSTAQIATSVHAWQDSMRSKGET